jgi:hypothetical protein
MRHRTLLAAGIILVGASGNAGALPAAKSHIDNSSNIQLVQDKKSEKSDTLKKRVKRAWKDLTGYKFDVACPGFWLPINQSVCTETGKNHDVARSKCEAQHALCQIRDADRS